MFKHIFCFTLVLFYLSQSLLAQNYYSTGHLYNIKEKDIYYTNNNTLIKPIIGCENTYFDSLIFKTDLSENKNLFIRKLQYEHLLVKKNDKFKIILDPILDFRINYDSYRKDISFLNTRGFNLQVNLISKVYINTSFYENQGKFPKHIHDFYNEFGTIPGYGRIKQSNDSVFDFSNSYGSIGLKLTDYLNFTLGYDKIFIGDGYRSMILSDFSAPYMFFKTNIKIGRSLEYNNIISKTINPNYKQIVPTAEYNINSEYPSKIVSHNYITYNIKKNLQITMFESLVLSGNTNLSEHLSYSLLPYIRDFLVGFESNKANLLLGLNLTYQNKKIGILYAQFVIDEINNSKVTKAGQLGYKNFDFLNIKNLYFQIEYNTADKYMYTSNNSEIFYGHQNQALAHPAGNCFDEFITICSYSLKKFELLTKLNYLRYKKDLGYNLQNIFYYRHLLNNSYTEKSSGNQIFNFDVQLIYNLNASNRLQLFVGTSYRSDNFYKTNNYFLNFGLRTALRFNYYDF